MSDYIIETCSLTKMYGEQASVSEFKYPCKEGAYLWSVGTKWCRKNHDYENVVRSDGSHIRRSEDFRKAYLWKREENSSACGLFDRIPRLLSQLDRNGKSENFCEAAWAERFQLH